jgi:hypothetical protein
MKIKVGDLVRVRGKDWLQKPLGVVIEIQDLIHDQTRVEYTVITALVGGEHFTFSATDFELVSATERGKI